MQSVVDSYDKASRKELATKADLADAKHEILKWIFSTALAPLAVMIAGMGTIIALMPR